MILVPSTGTASDAGLRSWSRILSLKLSNLIYDPALGLKNASRVVLRANDSKSPPSVIEMERLWQQAKAVQVIAAISFSDGPNTVIETNVYLGDLKGHLNSPLLPVKQTVRVTDYVITRDLVALTLLYALAVDARGQSAVACELLQRAWLISKDLKLDALGLKVLADAIDESLRDEKCRLAP